jgi:hypothetical protein
MHFLQCPRNNAAAAAMNFKQKSTAAAMNIKKPAATAVIF